ncbi:MAG: bifunctional salicylyl-CoA 5-hydroxylase/oxidoreductase [Myxococcota bacterium]
MRVACMGGGPAGLYLGISLKLRDPKHEVTVIERNRPNDTFGWGVVLSDETLENLKQNDPVSAELIRQHFAYWDDIAVVRGEERVVSSGHGFCGIGRKKLLELLQQRAGALGVDMQFEREAGSTRELENYDLIVGADGLNSRVRNEFAEVFRPKVDRRLNKFVWLGTHQKFDDAFTFIFERTKHGWVWAHAYQFDRETATFIVECSEETWAAFGFGEMSKEDSNALCEKIFERHLEGHPLISNAHHIRGSAWLSFPRVLCERWYHGKVVLLGDSAATAHFSIGSGTKLAMESAIALADAVHEQPLETALPRYEEARRVEVLRLQSAARNSLEWFEDVERYLPMALTQFNYSLLTRSQRISHDNLRLRDAEWLGEAEKWFQAEAGAPDEALPPMFAPFQLRDMRLDNRVVVSPMAQYKAVDGEPTDWHLVHYGERAKGGAGLLYTEMTCVSPEGRITPGCPGLYTDGQQQKWRRIVDFVHAETETRIALQLGHSGPKGSTQLGWEEMDAPLLKDNWPLMAPSELAWSPRNSRPRAMNRDDMDRVKQQFVEATERAARCGFDMLELHCAHGYLLSAFITPVSNRRSDEYGGCLENRLRFPLEVFEAMRAVWPRARPMSVRISAHDWVGDAGIGPEEAVEIARAFRDAGVDIVDVSAGQTSPEAQPVYGRMFQTPFSDRIRNTLDMPTMAVGNIYSPDHVNSILLAGRADLCCLARPHLADPYWTLRAAASQGVKAGSWPDPYLAGRDQLFRLMEKGELPGGGRA